MIIPCRNESKNIIKVLDSLKNQTTKPKYVTIVDDASTDNTFEVITEFIRDTDWVLIKRKNNNERYSSIVNAMKKATISLQDDFDYIMVLDGDTVIESKYIEKIIQKFVAIPMLGIAGGDICETTNRSNQSIDNDVVFGSNRIYSKKCWLDINEGKIMKVHSFAWDPEHSIRAKNRGYIVRRFDEVISHSIRIPSMNVPSFSRGVLRYQFGNSLPRTIISSILNFDMAFLAGYLDAWINDIQKIDHDKLMKELKADSDYKFVKNLIKTFKKYKMVA